MKNFTKFAWNFWNFQTQNCQHLYPLAIPICTCSAVPAGENVDLGHTATGQWHACKLDPQIRPAPQILPTPLSSFGNGQELMPWHIICVSPQGHKSEPLCHHFSAETVQQRPLLSRDVTSVGWRLRLRQTGLQICCERVVNVWNNLPASVDFKSLSSFKRTVKLVDLSKFLKCF